MKMIAWKNFGLSVILLLSVTQAFGQIQKSRMSSDPFGICSDHSKNPKCWEKLPTTEDPHHIDPCHVAACQIIKKSLQQANGDYLCTTDWGKQFVCNDLVEQIGPELKGLHVRVISKGIDMCHNPGSCGPSSCIKSEIYAYIAPVICPQPEL